ncbi:MAG: lysophospholipase [Candidatus Obscuribacterales bacterium]|nr:lysophospholipase [Candidatus Obscuribacterales bacterium]
MSSTVINLEPTSSVFELADQSQKPIYCRKWGDETRCETLALIIHGLGAHSGWFEALGSRLAERDCALFSFDQVGFGLRKDQSFNSRNQWQDEAIAVYNHLTRIAEGRAVLIMGNSMGALVAMKICSLLKPKPKGVAIFSPGFDGYSGRFTLAYKLKAIALALLSPDSELRLPFTVDDITSNQAVRDELAKDELKRLAIPARMGLELLKFTKELKRDVKSLDCPLFMATAGIETIVDNQQSEKFFENLDCPSKTRLVMEQSWHDLMFEEELPALIDALCQWREKLNP